MKADESIQYLDNKEFLDALFGYAYKRCSSSHEAEDLCSDIIVALLKSIRRQTNINNFYSFAWTIAHRVYADFSEKRKHRNNQIIMAAFTDHQLTNQIDPIDEFIKSDHDANAIHRIKREITFLSKMYRDVMIMYYLDEMKTSDIAKTLGILETTVKQRLFSARNTIRKEVEKMESTNLMLKPIKLIFTGTGSPGGNDPRIKAERIFSQNLVYLCKDTACSPKELSDLLHVPMPFIEEELEIQCRGENGNYGLLKKLDNNKYISNFIIIDAADFNHVHEVYSQYTTELITKVEKYLSKNKRKILDFPFLSDQSDVQFIAWSLISKMIWAFENKIKQVLSEKYYSNIEICQREFYTFGFAIKEKDKIELGLYGCDGIGAFHIGGCRRIFAANIYGRRIQRHFNCGHNISQDPLMLMTIGAIGGLDVNTLSEGEKEVAAKAIEVGYLKKEAMKLYPKILVIDAEDEERFNALSADFSNDIDDLVEPTVDAIHGLIQQYVPRHLIHEYHQFVLHTTSELVGDTIEKCIDNGILYAPSSSNCAEGTWMIVQK
jgi:RNA polymerase sigma factor (sigma-70 family)